MFIFIFESLFLSLGQDPGKLSDFSLKIDSFCCKFGSKEMRPILSPPLLNRPPPGLLECGNEKPLIITINHGLYIYKKGKLLIFP